MTLSIITDSLSLGRIDYNKNNDERVTIFHYETWPNLINSDKIYVNAKRERTTEFLISEECKYECIDLVNPDLIIVQIGIVDCAPRIFSRKEKRFMNMLIFPKILRDRLIKNRSKNRTKLVENNPLKKVYVDMKSFEFNLNDFIKQNQKSKIVFIPILYDEQNLDKSFIENCVLYNNLIYNLDEVMPNCHVLNIDNMIHNSDFFCKDAYHLSAKGHKEISNKLNKILN